MAKIKLPSKPELTSIAAQLGITGSYTARVVGDRIEFHCLGGPIVKWTPAVKPFHAELVDPPAADPAPAVTVIGNISQMHLDELVKLAAKLKIKGRSSMNKADLVKAIQKINPV